MKELIKTVALEVADQLDPERKKLGGDFQFGFNTVQLFAERVVAELSKRAEAVAFRADFATCLSAENRYVNWETRYSIMEPKCPIGSIKNVLPLFTFPPIRDIEAIENSVAEACASLAYETLDDTFLSGHGYATNISEAIRSGEWKKYK